MPMHCIVCFQDHLAYDCTSEELGIVCRAVTLWHLSLSSRVQLQLLMGLQRTLVDVQEPQVLLDMITAVAVLQLQPGGLLQQQLLQLAQQQEMEPGDQQQEQEPFQREESQQLLLGKPWQQQQQMEEQGLGDQQHQHQLEEGMQEVRQQPQGSLQQQAVVQQQQEEEEEPIIKQQQQQPLLVGKPLQQQLLASSKQLLPLCSPEQVVLLLESLHLLEVQPDSHWVEVLCTALAEGVDEWEVEALGEALVAVAKLELQLEPHVLQRVAEHALQLSEDCSAPDHAYLLGGLLSLGYSPSDDWLDQWLDDAVFKLQELASVGRQWDGDYGEGSSSNGSGSGVQGPEAAAAAAGVTDPLSPSLPGDEGSKPAAWGPAWESEETAAAAAALESALNQGTEPQQGGKRGGMIMEGGFVELLRHKGGNGGKMNGSSIDSKASSSSIWDEGINSSESSSSSGGSSSGVDADNKAQTSSNGAGRSVGDYSYNKSSSSSDVSLSPEQAATLNATVVSTVLDLLTAAAQLKLVLEPIWLSDCLGCMVGHFDGVGAGELQQLMMVVKELGAVPEPDWTDSLLQEVRGGGVGGGGMWWWGRGRGRWDGDGAGVVRGGKGWPQEGS